MYKTLAFSILFALIQTVAFPQNKAFLIHGKIDRSSTGRIYINEDNSGKVIASGIPIAGRFKISGKVNEPVKCTLTFDSIDGAVPLFLENELYDMDIYNDPFNYKITGGKLNSQFMEYGNSIIGYYEGWNQLKKILAENTLDTSNNCLMIKTRLDSSIAFLERKIIDKSEMFIQENKDSYIIPRVISNLLLLNKNNLGVATRYYNQLSKEIKFSTEGKYLKEWINNLENAPQIGTKIKPFTLRNERDIEIRFKRPENGKFVLINFWASWCGPCIQEFPELLLIYNKFKNKGFEIYNVSIDTDRERWIKFISSNRYPWIQLINSKDSTFDITKEYQLRSIPTSFLINENMTIIGVNLSIGELDAELTKRFNHNQN